MLVLQREKTVRRKREPSFPKSACTLLGLPLTPKEWKQIAKAPWPNKALLIPGALKHQHSSVRAQKGPGRLKVVPIEKS